MSFYNPISQINHSVHLLGLPNIKNFNFELFCSYDEETGQVSYSLGIEGGEVLTACLEHAGADQPLRVRKCHAGWAQHWTWSQQFD